MPEARQKEGDTERLSHRKTKIQRKRKGEREKENIKSLILLNYLEGHP